VKTILLLLSIAMSGHTIAQKKVTVSGNIQNPKGEMIYLTSYIVESGRIKGTVVHDSCIIEKGKFSLSTKIESLEQMYFWHGNESGWVFMQPGENLYLMLNTHFFNETIVFTGDGADRNNLMSQITVIMENMKLSKNILYGKFENDTEMDTIQLLNGLASIDSVFYDFMDAETGQHPELTAHLEDIKSRNGFITRGYIIKARRHLVFLEMQKKETGSSFLDVKGLDLEGKAVKVSDFYGKLTVLDFWATWCKPCIAEFPELHKLEEKFDGKVTFVGIGSKCKKEDWEKMAKNQGFHNNIFITEENMDSLSKKYSIHAIPRYIILDANGNLLNTDASRPSSGLEDQINELLK
jgi:thiol-disulfide isomerase/thioredoxin